LKDSFRNCAVSVASGVQLSLLAIQLQIPLFIKEFILNHLHPPPALNSSNSASWDESSG
jgi:hypothetical protein